MRTAHIIPDISYFRRGSKAGNEVGNHDVILLSFWNKLQCNFCVHNMCRLSLYVTIRVANYMDYHSKLTSLYKFLVYGDEIPLEPTTSTHVDQETPASSSTSSPSPVSPDVTNAAANGLSKSQSIDNPHKFDKI